MAIIWAAAIAGAAALGGSAIYSSSVSDAADESAKGSAQAIAEARRQFDIGQANQRPYLVAGTSALNTLARMYGLDTYTPAYPGTQQGDAQQATSDKAALAKIKEGAQAWETAIPGNGRGIVSLIDSGASLSQVNSALQALRATTTNPRNTAFLDPLIQSGQSQAAAPAGTYQPGGAATPGTGAAAAPDYSAFFASPDYKFRLDQSLKALEARAATGVYGGLDSGGIRKAVLERGGDLASGEFNAFSNRLANLAGIGQTTATNTAVQGQNFANTVGQIEQNAADTRATSYLQQGNAWANTVAAIGGGFGNAIERNANPYGYGGGSPYLTSYSVPGQGGYNPSRLFT